MNKIWKNELCTGCGACAAICPEEIIELDFVDKEGFYRAGISSDKEKECNGCGLCFQVCPAVSRNKEDPDQDMKVANLPALLEWLIGPYKKIYTGHAADNDLRYASSSGGVATALLMHLFKKEAIQGALVASPIPGKPMRHCIYLIRNSGDSISHRGTIYCQIDYSHAWKFIQENQDRLAIMGQPCHLKAVDLFMAIKELDTTKILKIGLFCGGTSSYRALQYLCERKKVSPDKTLNIRYRSGGWPGRKMIAAIPDPDNPGRTKEVVLFEKDASLLQSYLYNFCFSGSFFPKCCLICTDQTAECADISLGDAWLPRLTLLDTLGTNIIISRSVRAQQTLLEAVKDGIIQLEEAQPEDVLCSQGNCLVGRKLGLWGRHIKQGCLNIPKLMACRRYIPQYIPSKRLLLERRLLRWLTGQLPASSAFIVFLVYRLMINMLGRFIRMTVKVIKERA